MTKRHRIIRITGIILLAIFIAYIGLAFVLINLEDPSFKPGTVPTPNAAQMADMGFEQIYESVPSFFITRDGTKLFTNRFNQESGLTIVLLHGILASSYTYNKMAGLLREATHAEVVALDLRGHGQSAGRPGDVDYINQYADDVADLIKDIQKRKPGGKIILAGHSMGGGIALTYALRKGSPEVNGYLLFAPNLGYSSPTVPKKAIENKNADVTDEPFMKIHLSRILGLIMLNWVGIQRYNDLFTLFFNLPDEFPLKKYSFRSAASMAPEDYKAGLQAVDKPLLVIVGSSDEAFVAQEFKPTVMNNSHGEVLIIAGQTHNGIRHNKRSMEAVKRWIENAPFRTTKK